MKYDIVKMTKEVFITPDGKEYGSREQAESHIRQIIKDEIVVWLVDELNTNGGPSYDFSSMDAAEWVIDNYDVIGARLKGDAHD